LTSLTLSEKFSPYIVIVSQVSPEFLEYDVTFAVFTTTTGGSVVESFPDSELQLPNTIKSCSTTSTKILFFIVFNLLIITIIFII
jgi:hypothetical protein